MGRNHAFTVQVIDSYLHKPCIGLHSDNIEEKKKRSASKFAKRPEAGARDVN